MTHGPGRAAALPPLPFTLSLPVGGSGHCAPREVAAASNAGETPLGGHYGAGSTLGRVREPEEGEAKGSLRMGRASLWAARVWVGRTVPDDGLSGPRPSIRGSPLTPRRPSEVARGPFPASHSLSGGGRPWALARPPVALQPFPLASESLPIDGQTQAPITLESVISLFFLKQRSLSFGSSGLSYD